MFRITVVALVLLSVDLFGQEPAVPRSWKKKGTLHVVHAKDIRSSTWSIGGETLDRNYTNYQSYSQYLGPLGAKRIRLQGGWAKCEKIKGHYNFAWLDSVVNDAVSQGISPWIELSYGNPIYPDGGQPKLGGGIPGSEEALEAWDNWVMAMVSRYRNKVKEWEIWNEPDLVPDNISGTDYAGFYIRTARLIRLIQPQSVLMAFGLLNPESYQYVTPLFERLKKENQLSLINIFTYHGYNPIPENSYPAIEKLREVVWQYHPKVVFMQGENGAPSTANAIGALAEYEWSELTQAKWNLRRMLSDHGRGIATNLFTISDIHYAAGDHMVGINTKGLLKTNPDKTIDRPKLAYKAAQHVFSLFDDKVITADGKRSFADQQHIHTFHYMHKENGTSIVSIWYGEKRPSEHRSLRKVKLTVPGNFKVPVYADLISGEVYEIPDKYWKKEGANYVFTNIPVPDYPVLIADQSALQLEQE